MIFLMLHCKPPKRQSGPADTHSLTMCFTFDYATLRRAIHNAAIFTSYYFCFIHLLTFVKSIPVMYLNLSLSKFGICFINSISSFDLFLNQFDQATSGVKTFKNPP